MRRRASAAGVLAFVLLAALAAQQSPASSLAERIRGAEDARAATPDALAPMLEALGAAPGVRAGEPATLASSTATRSSGAHGHAQRLAIRALGRLQHESLLPHIVPLLASPSASVRAEAGTAAAQAVVGGRAVAAFEPLAARSRVEPDRDVLGTIARGLGRLPYATAAEVAHAEKAILGIAAAVGATSPARADVVHGIDALARRAVRLQPAGSSTLGEATRAWLRARAEGREDRGADAAFVRRLALSALVTLEAVDERLAGRALADPDDQVRRLAVLGAAAAAPASWVPVTLDRAADDPAFVVRHAALRVRAQAAPDTACTAALRALADASMHVSLLAIDVAGERCGGQADAVERLASLRRSTWHTRAHALVAAARLDPARGREWLQAELRLAPSMHWPSAMYAARAAGILRDGATLRRLAEHPHPNVVEAALATLQTVPGEEADDVAIAALARDDHQLLLTAARALAATRRRAEAATALVAALARVTARGQETSRDARLALLDRLEELGRDDPDARAALRARLTDFDPMVAGRAAAILRTWTGEAVSAAPRPLPRAPLPSDADLARWRTTEVVMTLARGGEVRIRLFPDEAPANVARFVRLIERRYFDGLTFHRVEPGFVIQGGSPNGNEYVGDGPFTRDEFGARPHRRGTIGISTRGRDTGDGQIFVNLVDNPRLDHAYTIVGEAIGGMDAIDRVLEADAIATVRLAAGH